MISFKSCCFCGWHGLNFCLSHDLSGFRMSSRFKQFCYQFEVPVQLFHGHRHPPFGSAVGSHLLSPPFLDYNYTTVFRNSQQVFRICVDRPVSEIGNIQNIVKRPPMWTVLFLWSVSCPVSELCQVQERTVSHPIYVSAFVSKLICKAFGCVFLLPDKRSLYDLPLIVR